MLNKYKLGESIIETTQERYDMKFKEMGYIPCEDEEITKQDTKKKDK